MAFNKNQVVMFAFLGAFVFLSSAIQVSGEDGESVDVSETDQRSSPLSGLQENRLPVLVLRQGSGGQDMFLGWMNWPAFSQFKPFFKPIQDNVGPTTTQLSGQMFQIPGVEQANTQFNQFGSQISGITDPSQFMSNLQGLAGGSGGLNGIFSQMTGRR